MFLQTADAAWGNKDPFFLVRGKLFIPKSPAPSGIPAAAKLAPQVQVALGSGTGGKWMATTMAQEGMRTAVVERRYIGGACVNIACLPSENVIHTAKVASLVRRHQEFGIQT
jgi:hypothetical protein